MNQWQLVGDRPFAQFYVPLPATTDPKAYLASILLIRTSGDPYAMTAEIHRELTAISPALAYLTVQPLDERIAPQLRPWRLGATMFGIFGALALLIAAVGLYSSLAYTVAQRTHEIGVRMALGARAANVVRLVAWSGLRTVLVGIIAGIVVAIAAGRTMAAVLYGISPRDPLTLAAVSVTFALVALVASLVPAWRAARVDPVVSLRDEG
jgi:ABC-type antimicrobial peptide transport system permease subunit